jgi:hypothetical protein
LKTALSRQRNDISVRRQQRTQGPGKRRRQRRMSPVPMTTVARRGGAFREKAVGAGQPFLWRERASQRTRRIYLSKVAVKRHRCGQRTTPAPEALPVPLIH